MLAFSPRGQPVIIDLSSHLPINRLQPTARMVQICKTSVHLLVNIQHKRAKRHIWIAQCISAIRKQLHDDAGEGEQCDLG